MKRTPILALFLLSGMLGIMYEVLWIRFFTSILGSDVQSTSAVVTAFLLGLAIGGFLFGRRADRCARPLRLYGLLELSLAASQGVAISAFARIDALYALLYEAVPYETVKWLVFLVAFLFISIPSCLIGGTLPVLTREIARRGGGVGWGAAALYGINTLGAAGGALVLVLFLVPRVGFASSFVIVAVSSAALGVVALVLLRVPGGQGADVPSALAEAESPTPAGPGRWFLTLYAASGFAALGYEIVWSRLLTFAFKGTLKSFGFILALYLVGLGTGSLLALRLTRERFDRMKAFGLLELGAGGVGLGSLLLVWTGGAGSGLWICILLATVFLGTAFPVAVQLFHRASSGAGRSVGTVSAVNTLGSVLGGAASGFILVPWLGSRNTMLALCSMHLIIGSWCMGRSSAARRGGAWALAGSAAALGGVWALVPPDALWRGCYPGQAILEVVENAQAVLVVTEHERARSLYSGPFMCGSTARREVQRLQGHLAMLVHGRAERVLEIGYGVGEILRCVERFEPDEVDLVEIDPDTIPLANRHFAEWNLRASERPSVQVHAMDGRHYLAMTSRSYDVIMSDSFFVGSEGSNRLYTREHFEHAAAHLAPGGIMMAWVPLNMLSERSRVIVTTFASVFPHVFVWQRFQMAFLFGMLEPPRLDLARMKDQFERLSADDLAPVGHGRYVDVLSGFRLGPAEVSSLLSLGKDDYVHSEMSPVLDYRRGGSPESDAWVSRLTRGSMKCLGPFWGPMPPSLGDELRTAQAAYEGADEWFRRACEALHLPDGHPVFAFEARAEEQEAARLCLDAALRLDPGHASARLLGEELARRARRKGPG